MNKIELLGRISKDIEKRYTPVNNTMVARFNIAVNRRTKGEKQADFFEITAFGKTAEFICQYFSKGQQVAIIGRLQNNNYEDSQGKKHYSNMIIAEEVYFADSKKDNAGSNNIDTIPEYDDGLPF